MEDESHMVNQSPSLIRGYVPIVSEKTIVQLSKDKYIFDEKNEEFTVCWLHFRLQPLMSFSKNCSTEVSSDSNYLLPWIRLFMWLFMVSECRLLGKSGSVSRLVWATWHLCFCDVSASKKQLSALGSSYSSGYVYRAAWCFISSAVIRMRESVTVCQLWPQCVRPQDVII